MPHEPLAERAQRWLAASAIAIIVIGFSGWLTWLTRVVDLNHRAALTEVRSAKSEVIQAVERMMSLHSQHPHVGAVRVAEFETVTRRLDRIEAKIDDLKDSKP